MTFTLEVQDSSKISISQIYFQNNTYFGLLFQGITILPFKANLAAVSIITERMHRFQGLCFSPLLIMVKQMENHKRWQCLQNLAQTSIHKEYKKHTTPTKSPKNQYRCEMTGSLYERAEADMPLPPFHICTGTLHRLLVCMM